VRSVAGTVAYRWLERFPETWVWVKAHRARRGTELRPDTQLVLDGFPGSANSYVRAWVHFANADLRIASHQHSSAVVPYAVRHHLPVVISYREPVAAAASLMARFPEVSRRPPYGAAALFRWYIRFYEGVIAHAGQVVLLSFERATSGGMPDAVDAVRSRFGLDLRALPTGSEHLVLSYLKDKDRATLGDELEQRSSAPSRHRTAAIRRHQEVLLDPQYSSLRRRAQATYAQVTDLDGHEQSASG
jgi:hypothetical protein